MPQTSEEFLSNLAIKVDNCKEARSLVEEAKLQKQALANCKAATEEPDIENIKWMMSRFGKSGPLSIKFHGLKGDTDEWYGEPAFVNGTAWCVNAVITTQTDGGRPVKYLGVYLYGLNLGPEPVRMRFRFELHPAKDGPHPLGSYQSGDLEHTLDDQVSDWGEKEFLELTDVLANYYDVENDSCRITANVTEVELDDVDDE